MRFLVRSQSGAEIRDRADVQVCFCMLMGFWRRLGSREVFPTEQDQGYQRRAHQGALRCPEECSRSVLEPQGAARRFQEEFRNERLEGQKQRSSLDAGLKAVGLE